MPDAEQESINALAKNYADKICEKISASPRNHAQLLRELDDLKPEIVKEGAAVAAGEDLSRIDDEGELVWTLSGYLPDFNTAALYNTTASLHSLACAVFMGWLLGGLLSGLLSFVSLGGDILRAAAIFICVWASERLTDNPRARRILLACLGLGGLARFASMAASGLLRFGQFSAWRTAIFGAGAIGNVFKAIWLFGGALFIFVFFSKKITSLNIPAFRESLTGQIAQDLRLCARVFERVNQLGAKIGKLRTKLEEDDAKARTKRQKIAIDAILAIRASLAGDQRKFIDAQLASAGIELPADDLIIWNEEEHAPLYNTVGLIKNGDKAKVLKPAEKWQDSLVKGYAQRVS